MAEIKVTPAAQIRKRSSEGQPVQLLSGIVVKMRTVTPDRLLRAGKIPDILTPLVTHMFNPPSDQEDYRFLDEVDDFILRPRDEGQEYLEMMAAVDLVAREALVYPRIVDDPKGDDEIAIYDLDPSDRMWIFKLAFLSAESLSRFRSQQAGDVESVPDSQGDAQQAEPALVH